jgi:transposase
MAVIVPDRRVCVHLGHLGGHGQRSCSVDHETRFCAMSVVRACPITLTGSIRRVLKRRARGQKTPYRDKVRAQIVLLAAARCTNAAIAAELFTTEDTVRKWWGQFAEQGLEGLVDRPRSGRPRRFTAVQAAEVKSLACQLPAATGVPLSRWSAPELAREMMARGLVEQISASTVRRWLAADAIKPWRHRSWLFVRDPDFAAKASRVLDLYAGVWEGKPLGAGEYVISSDEKTSIQARCRCHPTLPPGKARAMRVNHEYTRGGALAYLAATTPPPHPSTGHSPKTTSVTYSPEPTATNNKIKRTQRPPHPS